MIHAPEKTGRSEGRLIVLVCPVKNEAWILPLFLAAASHIADVIIVADQGSQDGSREICRQFPKVRLIENPSATFNEPERQKLLLAEARKVRGEKVILALDADEILSATVFTSPQWRAALGAAPGTGIRLPHVQLWGTPGRFKGPDDSLFLCGFVDDGSAHAGKLIHSPRLPEGRSTADVSDVVLLHYQFTARERALSKQRWYQCYERLSHPEIDPVGLYRSYAWLTRGYARLPLRKCPKEWHEGWLQRGVDTANVRSEGPYWWDWQLLQWFEQYGEKTFARQDIWGMDWDALRREGQRRKIAGLPDRAIVDPRTAKDRLALALLRTSQGRFWRPWADKAAHYLGW